MFIEKINIKNFKCFDNNFDELNFSIPNGSLGSGLNIFVGENNCGKSIIFEAISFLRDGTKKSLDDLKIKKIYEECMNQLRGLAGWEKLNNSIECDCDRISEREYVLEEVYYEKASKDEYNFCIHANGLE